MKPHNYHTPGLPAKTNGLIDQIAKQWRRRIDKELAGRSGKERDK